MAPPVAGLTNLDITNAINAPLSFWDTLGRYDSADSCGESAIKISIIGGKESVESPADLRKRGALYGTTLLRARIWALALSNVECFATDDPRLKDH
jgi:hypothetical protein